MPLGSSSAAPVTRPGPSCSNSAIERTRRRSVGPLAVGRLAEGLLVDIAIVALQAVDDGGKAARRLARRLRGQGGVHAIGADDHDLAIHGGNLKRFVERRPLHVQNAAPQLALAPPSWAISS